MKKSVKIFLIILAVVLVLLIIGFCIFLYIHGNTKPYTVPDEVHEAIVNMKDDKNKNEVRIMSSNLLVYYPSWHGSGSKLVGRNTDARPRAKIYFDVLETFKPDVIGLQEVCDRWYNCLLRNDYNYKFVQPVRTALTVRMTNLMYNADTTELLESGEFRYSEGDNSRLRCIVWGLFRDKATLKEYIVTSTHLSLIREDKDASLKIMENQAKEFLEQSNILAEKYKVPVYHTGDFNSVNNVENWVELFPERNEEQLIELLPDEEAIKIDQAPTIYTYIADNLTDTKLAAKEFKASGKTTFDSPAYDHIFINGKNEISKYVVLSDQSMLKLSDHYSVFIDTVL